MLSSFLDSFLNSLIFRNTEKKELIMSRRKEIMRKLGVPPLPAAFP
jgi:hypothetical protein